MAFRQLRNISFTIIIVDIEYDHPESKKSRGAYIPEEVLRPLARMIACRLLAELSGEVVTNNDPQNTPETMENLSESCNEEPTDILKNNCRKLKGDKMPKAYLEPSEIEKLEEAATNLRDKLFIHTLFRTACRVSENIGLAVDDIDFAHCSITIQHLKYRISMTCPGCNARLGKSHRHVQVW